MDNEYPGAEKRQFKRARVSLTVIYRANEPLSLTYAYLRKGCAGNYGRSKRGGYGNLG